MNQKINQTTSESSWQECPPGVLQSLSKDLRAVSRRQLLAKAGGGVAATTLAGWGIWQLTPSRAGWELSCRQVQPHLPDHLAKRLKPPLAQQVAAHLEVCRKCRDKLERLKTA